MKGDGQTGRSWEVGPPSNSKSKPAMEKRRRDRINASLAELRSLIPETRQKLNKMEKADILEVTVKYLRQLQETNGASEKTRATSRSYCLGFNECAQEVSQFFRSQSPFSTRVKGSLLDHLGKCAPHNPPDSPSSSPTKKTPDQFPVSATTNAPGAVTTTAATTTTSSSSSSSSSSGGTTALARTSSNLGDSILSRCLLSAVPVTSTTCVQFLQGKESSPTTSSSTTLFSSSSSSSSSSSTSFSSNNIISCLASERTNVSTPVAVSSTSDDLILAYETVSQENHDENIDAINNNKHNHKNNDNNNSNNNDSSSNSSNDLNKTYTKINSDNNCNEKDFDDNQPFQRTTKIPIHASLGCPRKGEGQINNERNVTLLPEGHVPNVDSVKRDLFAVFIQEEKNNNNIFCAKNNNDSCQEKVTSFHHPDGIVNSSNGCQWREQQHAGESDIKQSLDLSARTEAQGDQEVRCSPSSTPSLSEAGRSPRVQSSIQIPKSNVVPHSERICQPLANSSCQSSNEQSSEGVHRNLGSTVINFQKEQEVGIEAVGQRPPDRSPSSSQKPSCEIEKSPAYLIPIYIQTSLGQGEIPSIQQAFVINQPSNGPGVSSSSQTSATPAATTIGSNFSLTTKFPESSCQSSEKASLLNANSSTQLPSNQSDDSLTPDDKEPEISGIRPKQRQLLCSPPPLRPNSGEGFVRRSPEPFNNFEQTPSGHGSRSLDLDASEIFPSFRTDTADGMMWSAHVQSCKSFPNRASETDDETVSYRYYDEDDYYPHHSSFINSRYLAPGSCYTSEDEECHEVEHLTAGGTIPLNGLVWEDDFNDDIDDPMDGPSDAKRCRQGVGSPFLDKGEIQTAFRTRKQSFTRRSPRDFRPRKTSMSYRPIAPKPHSQPVGLTNADKDFKFSTNPEDKGPGLCKSDKTFLSSLPPPFPDYNPDSRGMHRRRCFTFSQNFRRKPLRGVSPISGNLLFDSRGKVSNSSSESVNLVTSSGSPVEGVVRSNSNAREVLVARRRCSTFSARDLSSVPRFAKASGSLHPETHNTSTDSRERESDASIDQKPSATISQEKTPASSAIILTSPRKRSSTFSVAVRRPNLTKISEIPPASRLAYEDSNSRHQRRLFSSREDFRAFSDPNSSRDGLKCAWAEERGGSSQSLDNFTKPPLQFQKKTELKGVPVLCNKTATISLSSSNYNLRQEVASTATNSSTGFCTAFSRPHLRRAGDGLELEATSEYSPKITPLNITSAMDIGGTETMPTVDNSYDREPANFDRSDAALLDVRSRRSLEHRKAPLSDRASPLNLSIQKRPEVLFTSEGDRSRTTHKDPALGLYSSSSTAWLQEEMRPRSWSMSSGISSLSLEGPRAADASMGTDYEDVWRPW